MVGYCRHTRKKENIIHTFGWFASSCEHFFGPAGDSESDEHDNIADREIIRGNQGEKLGHSRADLRLVHLCQAANLHGFGISIRIIKPTTCIITVGNEPLSLCTSSGDNCRVAVPQNWNHTMKPASHPIITDKTPEWWLLFGARGYRLVKIKLFRMGKMRLPFESFL